MTDEPLRANPEDRPAPPSGSGRGVAVAAEPSPGAALPANPSPAESSPTDLSGAESSGVDAPSGDQAPADPATGLPTRGLSTAHTRPIRPARQRSTDRRPAWSGFLLGVLTLVFAIGLAGLLWRFAGIEGSGEAPAAAVAPVIAPVIAPADLMEIETLLDQLGFPPGPLDGVIDAESIAAIHDFQATAGLPVDGAPSAALLEELRAALAELSGG